MRTLPIVITVVLLAAGCGGGSDDAKDPIAVQPSSQAPAATSPAPSGRLRSLPPKLKFEAKTLDDKPFTGANLAEKPVVFWFWAPWCPKCLSEGPDVAKVAKKYEGRVAFVGIAGLDKNKGQMEKFVSRTGTSGFPHLDDRTGTLYKHFEVVSQSSFLFMKRDGSGERASGPLGEDDLESRVGKLASG